MTLQQSLKHASDMHNEILESTVVCPLGFPMIVSVYTFSMRNIKRIRGILIKLRDLTVPPLDNFEDHTARGKAIIVESIYLSVCMSVHKTDHQIWRLRDKSTN